MNKTWATFQDLFTAAHETYESLTAQGGGYHGANHVQTQETEKFYNETANAFANLAMAATSDKELILTFTNTNSTLTSQLSAISKRSTDSNTTCPTPQNQQQQHQYTRAPPRHCHGQR
jgi:hypothetical protein